VIAAHRGPPSCHAVRATARTWRGRRRLEKDLFYAKQNGSVLVENISLHSVYDTTKCTRDGDMLTAGGAVGGVPFEPCRRRSCLRAVVDVA
jgi:hypothetical protein